MSCPATTVYQVAYSIPQGSTSFSCSAVRACSRLTHLWLTSQRTGTPIASDICFPNQDAFHNTQALLAAPALSDAAQNCPAVRANIGPKTFPAPQPVATIAEHFYLYQKTVPNADITRGNFLTNAFSIVVNLCKSPHYPQTGRSTRSGELLRVGLTNIKTGTAAASGVPAQGGGTV